MLKVGDIAPMFNLPDQNGEFHNLKEYRGEKLVLYFYPKDNTPGCSIQAVGFSNLIEEFKNMGTQVIGISKDSVKSHKKFQCDKELNFTILSDEGLEAIKAYDVWQEKKNYGKTYMGVVRTTYLIDEEGVIVFASDKVKTKDNPMEMLELVGK